MKAIRAINESEEVSESKTGKTDTVQTPATTTRIREVTTLNTDEVQHRLKRSKKLDELIEVFPAPVYENGQRGPKSARLTAEGEDVLDQITSGEPARTTALMERLDQLSNEVEAVQETVAEFKESSTGALDDQEVAHFEAVKKMMVTFQNVFEEEFDIDLEEHRPDGD